MASRQSPSIGLVTAALLILPFTLLGACAEQGGDGADETSADETSADGTSADETSADGTSADGTSAGEANAADDRSDAAPTEPLTPEVLLGEWIKVDEGNPDCADYPDQLTFESFGYLTSLHDDRAPVLDGGSWEIDGDQLVLSNPLDAMVPYPAALTNDVLELDAGTCMVRYRRFVESDGS